MKKTFLLVGAMALTGLIAPKASAQGYELRVLTFEDGSEKSGFEAVNGLSGWSDLIDDPQQYGQLLYGDNNMGTEDPYMWTDGGNTELHHEFIDAWGMGSYAFYGGGEAISHYWSSNYATYGDYMNQLTAYRPDAGSNDMNTAGGGHNGSNNFCVHFGYIDDTGYGVSEVPAIVFTDGVARVIDHVYVCPTTYTYYTVFQGNDLTDALGEDGKLWIQARGFASAEDSEPSATTEFLFFAGDGSADTRDWTKWDLSDLGAIEKLEFNMYGEGSGSDNGYGLSQAAYFAWDDMAVRFPVSTPEPEEPTSYERTGLTAVKSERVNAPVVEEFPVTIECELAEIVRTDNFQSIVGKIVNVMADESVLDENGKVDIEKSGILMFDQFKNGYYVTGEKVGQAWQTGMELK